MYFSWNGQDVVGFQLSFALYNTEAIMKLQVTDEVCKTLANECGLHYRVRRFLLLESKSNTKITIQVSELSENSLEIM